MAIDKGLLELADRYAFDNLGLSPAEQALRDQLAQAQQMNVHNPNPFLKQSLLGAQQASENAQWLPPQPLKPSTHMKAIELLKLRLGGLMKEFKLTNDEFLICHVYKDTVFVFFVAHGKAGHTEESVNEFPSDKLVAQLRMIWS